MGNFFSSLMTDPTSDSTAVSRVLVRSDGSVSNLFPVSCSTHIPPAVTNLSVGRIYHD